MQISVIQQENIPYSSDYELNRSIISLSKRLSSINRNWRTSKDESVRDLGLFLETEICYLQREVMWRKKREKCHEEYVKNLRK